MIKRNWQASFRELFQKPAFRIVSSILILGLLLKNLPLIELINTFKQISLALWLFILTAFIIGHVCGAIKWRLWINTGENSLPIFVALRCYFAGLFANLFLPSLAGGDIFRAGLAIRFNNEKESIIFGTLLDRFLDTISLVLIILIGVYFAPEVLFTEDRNILAWIFILMIIFVLCGLFLLNIYFLKFIPKKSSETIIRIHKIINHMIKNPSLALVGFGIAILIQIGFVLLGALLAVSCGIDLPWTIWLFAWPLAKLSAMLPISIGGLGVREIALATILSRFGVPFVKSVGLGLIWETILIAGGGFGGLFYFFLSRNIQLSPKLR